MFSLKDKVALVTGSRRGMGKAHAIALASQGAKVVITDVNEGECAPVVAEIQESGGEAACFKLDVSNKAEVDSVFDKIIERFGRLDILVNNAGIFEAKPALQISEEEWDRMIDIDLKGQFLCAQRAAQEMAKNNWGRIINIGSIASGGVGVGFGGAAHYTAAKGGVVGMSETLAVEWAPLNITVNVIAPGGIDTPMANPENKSEEEINKLFSRVPLKRIGHPEEVAAAVVFLASPEASYITGATLYVDGGWLAS